MRVGAHEGGFVGRRRELAALAQHLDRVRAGGGDQRGRALLLRGRRRVGKSRLVEVFCEGSEVPWVFFAATRGAAPSDERRAFFRTVVTESTLPDRELLAQVEPSTWEAALRQLAAALPDDQPSIVVLDEAPYLMAQDPAMEGALQTVWDRSLSRKPTLLVLVGSDLAVMEALSDYRRPFHQRAAEMVLGPLTPHEVGQMLGLDPADALDAFLVTGGLPLVCRDWLPGSDTKTFLRAAFEDPTSALIVSGERILAAEFPNDTATRRVLTGIGGQGERTFSNIARQAGADGHPLHAGTVTNALRHLVAKRVVAVDVPLSARAGDANKRYRIADPYLRFWFCFVEPTLAFVERGRADLALRRWDEGWSSWRGRAAEPVVREALMRLLPDEVWPDVAAVGGWWPRSNHPEVDLVGADRASVARRISFVGTIKWHDTRPVDHRDVGDLAAARLAVPGADVDTPLVAVSRSGFATDALAARWSPDELIRAWV